MPTPDFQVYFPDLGETLSDAEGVYARGLPRDAAEIAAERRCSQDTEWSDHKVAVHWGGTTVTYNVEFRQEPNFYASEVSTEYVKPTP